MIVIDYCNCLKTHRGTYLEMEFGDSVNELDKYQGEFFLEDSV